MSTNHLLGALPAPASHRPWLRYIDVVDGAQAAPPEDTDTPDEPDGDDDTDAPIEGEDALGDAGKRALEAIKAKHKAERTKRLALEEKLRDATKADTPDADAIRAEADRDAIARANTRIVRAEVKGAASGLLQNPADALAFLDLTTFDVDDDGEVDADEIQSALKDLIAQ